MKNLKNLILATLLLAATALSSCLHIIEEATFRNNGSGTYKLTFDMSELKGMIDMMKGMGEGAGMEEPSDSSSISDGGDFTPDKGENAGGMEDPMGGLGQQFKGISESLSSVDGISNVIEINDTSEFQYGYSFEFSNVQALNRALKIVGKERFESGKSEDTFKFTGKSFERLGAGDMSAQLKEAMGGGEDDADESQADMMKMFLADMSYKQIYHFPDHKMKKSSNKLGEVGDNGHTVTITLKPFNEDQQKQKASVATKVKLK